MKVVLPIVGALIGASVANDASWLFGLLLGAFAGYALQELSRLRALIGKLQDHIELLQQRQDSQAQRAAAAPVVAAAQAAATVAQPAAAQPTQPAPVANPGESSGWQPYQRAAAAAPVAPAAAGNAQSSASAAPTPAPVAQASPAKAPAEPAIVRMVREYFTGGNTLVRVGIIILFFGVAFLLRYVAEHTQVPIEFRLTGVAAAAIVLLALGWRLRVKRAGYALALQGGAIGILYLTVFAALKLYGLMSPALAFPLLVLIAALSAALAILQNSQAFALLGVTGGFLAPILASTGEGSHVVLFSYYAVLNAGILAVAWFKAWRPLNLAGFLFTFVIGTAWGALRYRSELFATTEPFLVLFFLFYVAIAILFALRQPPQLRGYVDGTLIFGTPIVAFGLQAGMLHDERFTLAFSALAVSALYLTLAWMLHRRGRETLRLLVEAHMALGVAFLTLAVPLALDGRWSAATWALEGAALVWIGCRQNRRLPRAAGALLQIAGGIIFWSDIDAPHGAIPVLNSACLGGIMVSVAAIFSTRILQAARERLAAYESAFAPVLFFWGLAWWLIAGLAEISRRVASPHEMAAALVFIAATALLSSLLQRRYELSVARIPPLALLPVMLLFALAAAYGLEHPLAQGGWVAWPVAFGIFYWICRRHEGVPGERLATMLHVGAAWLLAALASWELAWAIDKAVAGSGSWPAIAWALVPGVLLFALIRLHKSRPLASGELQARPDQSTAPLAKAAWPLDVHRQAYVLTAGAGFACYLALWSLMTNLSLRGDPAPLPYVPLLNPLDLAQLFVLLVLARFALLTPAWRGEVFSALAALAFVWLNAALLRTLHHWARVPFELEAMLRSTLVQTSLSIFWTSIALATMLVATRRGSRIVWLTGAGLLVVVIAKLFLVDLSRIGSVERIVSFVGVGLLMLVIGYFSPLPPANAKARA